MQEKQQRLKLSSEGKRDDWICHHKSDRDSVSLGKSIHTDKSKQQTENVSLISEDYRQSSNKSKIKRLSANISQKKLLVHLPTIHIPEMSEKTLKRWCEARDTYLDQQYPHRQKHRRIKQKDKTLKNEEISSIFTCESEQFSGTDLRHRSLEKQQSQNVQIIGDHFKDECVGTEINEAALLNTDIKRIDQANQVDLPFSQFEIHSDHDTSMIENEQKQQILSDQKSLEYCDKAIETDLILDAIEKENESIHQNIEDNTINSLVDPNINQINDDDTKTILSSTKSNTSVYEQLQILRFRFKRLSQERRLLSCILVLYVIIMCGLLVVIFLLLWAFQGQSPIFYEEVTMTDTTSIINGVARYGESCHNDNDCKQPFTCYKKRSLLSSSSSSSSSGICRCPLKYDFVNNQCIGDLNALCRKDTDCQRYMLCSGMVDGTRRCHCQTLYSYDTEQKQCYGDYRASCQSNIDCRANLICNKTIIPPMCSCQLNYRYYPLVRKCRGDPGAICETATAECIDNAECRDGACECAFQYVPDENKRCVDPCPKIEPNPVRIRYPGNCRRFIDCQRRSKSECPEMTIFNFRTQLCDYPKNVLDCR
ncbi:unnamed protein product [Rotaria sordida]|uniref:Chitin-binding type-2 domain-containing protein n=1 Tax=Rotaria sordida TaxID=392033 RepID=A0A813XEY2_9BILA|nr:unnamed protein product [Rotaria sordida]CAF1112252.1 unnamed protein product [Rotaria sordida]